MLLKVSQWINRPSTWGGLVATAVLILLVAVPGYWQSDEDGVLSSASNHHDDFQRLIWLGFATLLAGAVGFIFVKFIRGDGREDVTNQPTPEPTIDFSLQQTSTAQTQSGAGNVQIGNLAGNVILPPPSIASEPPPEMWWGMDLASQYLFFNVRNRGSVDEFAVEIAGLNLSYRAYWHDHKETIERTLRNGETDWLRVAQLNPNGWMEFFVGAKTIAAKFREQREQGILEIRLFSPEVDLFGTAPSRLMQIEAPYEIRASVLSHKRNAAVSQLSFGATLYPVAFVVPFDQTAMERAKAHRIESERLLSRLRDVEPPETSGETSLPT